MPELVREQTKLQEQSQSQWISTSQSESGIVTSLRRSRAINLSRQLSISSPLGNRILSAILDFVIPSETELIVEDTQQEAVTDLLNHFWYEGPSALSLNARDLIFTLFVDGEILIKRRVNDVDGRVTLTNISADSIEEVHVGEGFNAVTALTINDPTTDSEDPVNLKVIRKNAAGFLEGDIFYFRVFPAGYAHGVRGLPLLTHILDELAVHSEMIYTRIQRISDLSSFYWDVTMEGATQDQIDEFLQSPRAVPPESGETFAHNERVNWELVSPPGERRLSALMGEMDFYTQLITGSTGLTPEFIGRAPARDITTESLFASIAHLTAIREVIFNMLILMLQYQFEMGVKHNGAINEIPRFRIMATEIGSRSLQRAAQAFARYADGLQKAVNEGLMTPDEASNVLKLLLTQLGLVTDLEMEDVAPARYFKRNSEGSQSRESQKHFYGIKLYGA